MGGRRMLGKVGGETGGILTLEFDDILNAPVADPNDVADWNTLFDLPTNGTVFDSVTVDTNTVTLTNSGTINLTISAFGTSGATNSTNLISIVDTDVITNCDTNAFRRQTALTTATLPVLDTSGANIFDLCTGLITVDISTQTKITTSMFEDCSSLTSVTAPLADEVRQNAFSRCTSLVNISLPSVTAIRIFTFNDCTSLETCDTPLTTIVESNAFRRTTSLISINFPLCTSVGLEAFRSDVANSTATTFLLPSALDIGNSCFRNRDGLTTLNLASCTSLGTTTGPNGIFVGISGNTITFTLPVGTRTDGDATALAASNTVTFLP